ncbi:MAG: ribose-phosphate pyrophosphokinase [Enterobacteriaceae bacterium PSmelAO3-2]|nr:ribose-phosphate pyrophosphokinase [Enterobacteriaceae bacterium Cmel17]WMC17403.1 MAG: ribose-phosphate pyrophosphokinase [Enterobacteriaceae bacterium Cmel21]WMC17609.1 MAG: ribose-phosphate pyrophosphokinase [Enterobacteriaceae bacterium PSmelAO3-2]WMC17814.1 MAG: ribose-phosphate pyrophosphokinase [Enterobacteriaceae bacterium PSmelAO3-1]WMC18017.1 MAG: ribose-phosphate pyrophosphokinase [Enterobacteriaceae bacterium PSmelAO1]
MPNIKIFAGNSNTEIAKKISKKLKINLSCSHVGRFSDGEINIQVNENVRGDDVFIIQSICSPSNDNLMELLIMVDALRRASAGRITAVIPYFGYARQDRKIYSSRVPITAKLIANFLTNVGVNRILTVDLHSEQIQGFFDIPVDNIFGSLIFYKDIIKKKKEDKITIVSPDIGGVIRARAISKILNDVNIAIIDKRRNNSNTSQVMHIIGNVINKNCILIDDMIDTGGTLCKAAKALKKNGATKVYAYVTHPVFSGNSTQYMKYSEIDKITVCDSIPLSKKISESIKINTQTLSNILAESIRRIHNGQSISEMFKI